MNNENKIRKIEEYVEKALTTLKNLPDYSDEDILSENIMGDDIVYYDGVKKGKLQVLNHVEALINSKTLNPIETLINTEVLTPVKKPIDRLDEDAPVTDKDLITLISIKNAPLDTKRMIALLLENPSIAFVSKKDVYSVTEVMKAYVEHGTLYFANKNGKPVMGHLSLNRLWEKEEQPVSFENLLKIVKRNENVLFTATLGEHSKQYNFKELREYLCSISNKKVIEFMLEAEFYI